MFCLDTLKVYLSKLLAAHPADFAGLHLVSVFHFMFTVSLASLLYTGLPCSEDYNSKRQHLSN